MKAYLHKLTIIAAVVPAIGIAGEVGFEFSGLEDPPNPGFLFGEYRFTNLSNTQCGTQITDISVGIDPRRAWDVVFSRSGQAVLNSDTDLGGNNDGVFSPLYEMNFSSFAEGEQYITEIDIDLSGAGGSRFTEPFFDNGGDANAIVTVQFDNGVTMVETLPDGLSAVGNQFTYSAFQVVDDSTVDSDGDGQNDAAEAQGGTDPCTAEIVIGDINTGIADRPLSGGLLLSELIASELQVCRNRAASAKKNNHGKFVSCMAKALNDAKKAGHISSQERGNLQSAAAQSK